MAGSNSKHLLYFMCEKALLYKFTVITWNIPNKLTLTCDKLKLGTEDETCMIGGGGV
jgi:predicted transglutaminase-like protease